MLVVDVRCGLDVAQMKHIALSHIFISYSLDSLSMTMHLVTCTTEKFLFFVAVVVVLK